MPRWDRELAGRLISRYRVTHWTSIPTMVIDLLASPQLRRSTTCPACVCIGGGGAAMPQAVAQRLLEQFGLTFAEGYGLTETAAPSHSNPPERAQAAVPGHPDLRASMRAWSTRTRCRSCRRARWARSSSAARRCSAATGSSPRPPRRPSSSIDGKRFFRTGDLGRIDEEGYFFITDRLKRMINASGFKVWPAEVEVLMYKHPAVQEACVIGAQDAYRGETREGGGGAARRSARARPAEQDIIDWAREHMAAYKAPRIVRVRRRPAQERHRAR